MIGLCSRCSTGDHRAGARFCDRCGAALAEAGPRPAGAAPPDAAGYTPAHLAPVLAVPDAREGERKDVTVLFADVKGSLALTAALDPEDLHEVMDGFFAVAGEAIHAEGGRINQYRGDGFMALFGAPRAVADNAARACRAALAAREALVPYAESVLARFGHPLRVRTGINTGLVWVGSIGSGLREDYTAEGTTVGLAARLEERAEPDQILVAEETWRRCAPFFTWRDLGEHAVRGLEGPVRVHALLGEGPQAGGLEAEHGPGATPLAGRGRERAELARLATPAPGLRFVEVAGEPGIGKSRLVLEHVRALPPDTVVLELFGREAHAQRAFLPWLELLRRRPGPLERDAEAPGLVDRLERGSAAADARPVAAALAACVARAVAAGPTVLVVDDAQWVDPSSRNVLRQLAVEPADGSLVVLATTRGEVPGEWAPGAPVRRLALGPLGEEDARELARAVLAPLEDVGALVELAVMRGGGHPLFVEEVARALRDGGEDLRRAARLEMALRREPARVPDTLRGAVAARVDALPPSAKRAAEAAAILGQPFDVELLAGLEAGAPAALPDLVRRGIVRRAARDEYDFCHGVVRDVAAGQLVRARRRALHRRAAEHLAQRPTASTADGAARIGAHFDQADDGAAATPYLLRAGELYARLDAMAEAASQLGRGLERLRQGADAGSAEEARVAVHLAGCLNALDRAREAREVLGSVSDAAASQADPSILAGAFMQSGWLQFHEDREFEAGRALVERGLALVDGRAGQRRLHALGLNFRARMLMLDGRAHDALSAAQDLVAFVAEDGDDPGEVMSRMTHVQALCYLGRMPEARASADVAFARLGSRSDPMLRAMAWLADANARLAGGEADAALESVDRSRRAAEEAGQLGVAYQALMVAGYAHLLRGEPRRAHACFERMAASPQRWADLEHHRARGLLEVGRLEDAAAMARRSVTPRTPRLFRLRAQAILGLATGLADPTALEDAQDLLTDAISALDALGLGPLCAEARLFLAELLAERGLGGRARYYAERAREDYGRFGMVLHAEAAARLEAETGA